MLVQLCARYLASISYLLERTSSEVRLREMEF